jgi:prepilin-type N-terminal cleavage/methylation domain-containing protein
MNENKSSTNRRSAFTLIELLAVIAIIAVLAALLFAPLTGAKDKARRASCMNSLKQINLGVRMYCDDSKDSTPDTRGNAAITNAPWIAYKQLMKEYVGLQGASSPKERLFACPADAFYYDWVKGYVAESHHNQSQFDFSSYTFNSFNLATFPTNFVTRPGIHIDQPGVGGKTLSSIRNPTRTVLIAESPAYFPYSWHEPRPAQPGGIQPQNVALFNDAKNMVSFADGHAAYIKIYWANIVTNGGFMSVFYDPPSGYEYQWSGN